MNEALPGSGCLGPRRLPRPAPFTTVGLGAASLRIRGRLAPAAREECCKSARRQHGRQSRGHQPMHALMWISRCSSFDRRSIRARSPVRRAHPSARPVTHRSIAGESESRHCGSSRSRSHRVWAHSGLHAPELPSPLSAFDRRRVPRRISASMHRKVLRPSSSAFTTATVSYHPERSRPVARSVRRGVGRGRRSAWLPGVRSEHNLDHSGRRRYGPFRFARTGCLSHRPPLLAFSGNPSAGRGCRPTAHSPRAAAGRSSTVRR